MTDFTILLLGYLGAGFMVHCGVSVKSGVDNPCALWGYPDTFDKVHAAPHSQRVSHARLLSVTCSTVSGVSLLL